MLDITYKFNLKYVVNKGDGTIKLNKVNKLECGEEEYTELGEIVMSYDDISGDITSVELLEKFGFYIRIMPADIHCGGYKSSRVDLIKKKNNGIYATYHHQFINDNHQGIIHDTPMEDIEKKITISIS